MENASSSIWADDWTPNDMLIEGRSRGFKSRRNQPDMSSCVTRSSLYYVYNHELVWKIKRYFLRPQLRVLTCAAVLRSSTLYETEIIKNARQKLWKKFYYINCCSWISQFLSVSGTDNYNQIFVKDTLEIAFHVCPSLVTVFLGWQRKNIKPVVISFSKHGQLRRSFTMQTTAYKHIDQHSETSITIFLGQGVLSLSTTPHNQPLTYLTNVQMYSHIPFINDMQCVIRIHPL